MSRLRKSVSTGFFRKICKSVNAHLRLGVLALAVLLLGFNPSVLVSSALYAEEKAVDDVDTGRALEGKEEPLPVKLSEMNLRQLRAYQKYVYIPGARDPLVFRSDGTIDDAIYRPPPPPPPPELDLSKALAKLTFLLRLRDYKQAVSESDKAIAEATRAWKGAKPTTDLLSKTFERIESLNRTARRLQRAKETRAEFEELPLRIRGILWTPKGAKALVNSMSYEVGQVVKGLKLAEGVEVQIEEIEESSVLFIFKGLRFRKRVGEIAKK